MINLRRAVLGAAVACLLSASAQAQPAETTVTPERLALAQKVVTEGRFDKQMKLVVETLSQPFIQQINAGSGSAELKSYTINLFRRRWPS